MSEVKENFAKNVTMLHKMSEVKINAKEKVTKLSQIDVKENFPERYVTSLQGPYAH